MYPRNKLFLTVLHAHDKALLSLGYIHLSTVEPSERELKTDTAMAQHSPNFISYRQL